MIQVTPQLRILVAVEPTDFRKGIDGLARVCKDALGGDPFTGTLFVFRNRRGTALKLLTYDGQGFWLCQKRLSAGRFRFWPTEATGPARRLEAHELQVLLAAGNPLTAQAAPAWRRVSPAARSSRKDVRSVAGSARVPPMDAILRYRGRVITATDLAGIQALIAAHPGASRRALSEALCQLWDWRQPNGALCAMVCRGLMLALHRAGHIQLPPVRRINPNPLARRGGERRPPVPVVVETTPLAVPLAALRPLTIQEVGGRPPRRSSTASSPSTIRSGIPNRSGSSSSTWAPPRAARSPA
ncbi:MAG: Orf2 like protein [Anaeromyxobacteraceae bacterium]|nr:Orf2 like protein [Anaeromyxobacteraceae bacterium]